MPILTINHLLLHANLCIGLHFRLSTSSPALYRYTLHHQRSDLDLRLESDSFWGS